MEYDFRGRLGSGSHGTPLGAAGGGGSSLYPCVSQPSHAGGGAAATPYHQGPRPGCWSSVPIVMPLAPTSSTSSKYEEKEQLEKEIAKNWNAGV